MPFWPRLSPHICGKASRPNRLPTQALLGRTPLALQHHLAALLAGITQRCCDVTKSSKARLRTVCTRRRAGGRRCLALMTLSPAKDPKETTEESGVLRRGMRQPTAFLHLGTELRRTSATACRSPYCEGYARTGNRDLEGHRLSFLLGELLTPSIGLLRPAWQGSLWISRAPA